MADYEDPPDTIEVVRNPNGGKFWVVEFVHGPLDGVKEVWENRLSMWVARTWFQVNKVPGPRLQYAYKLSRTAPARGHVEMHFQGTTNEVDRTPPQP